MKLGSATEEREWRAQQSAFDGVAGGDQELIARYKALAHGLRTLPSERLPPDFARHVAKAARRQDAVLGTFERVVLTSICLMFATGLLAVSVLNFSTVTTISIIGLRWIYIASICAAVAGMSAPFVRPRRFS
jgi:hypothetical protein